MEKLCTVFHKYVLFKQNITPGSISSFSLSLSFLTNEYIHVGVSCILSSNPIRLARTWKQVQFILSACMQIGGEFPGGLEAVTAVAKLGCTH